MCKKKWRRRLAAALGLLLACLLRAGTESLAAGTQDQDYVLAAENDSFELYCNPDSLAIRIREKATGYVYDSMGAEASGEI